jgi:hypothetical protein
VLACVVEASCALATEVLLAAEVDVTTPFDVVVAACVLVAVVLSATDAPFVVETADVVACGPDSISTIGKLQK